MKNDLAPRNFDEAMNLSEMFANSKIVPQDYQGNVTDCFVAIIAGASLGLNPFQAVQNISVINGRPAVWGDAMLAMVRRSKLCGKVEETIEGEGDAAKAVCKIERIHPSGELETIERSFSMSQAKRANLTARKPWQSYPARMLQMRARGFALRDGFADVLGGLITAEEAQDLPDDKDMPRANKPRTLKVVPTGSSTDDIIHQLEQSTTDTPKTFTLTIPGKRKDTFNSIQEFGQAYSAIVNEVKDYEGFTSDEKKKKLQALETANLEPLAHMQKVDATNADELITSKEAFTDVEASH